jgi:hypothetical protein
MKMAAPRSAGAMADCILSLTSIKYRTRLRCATLKGIADAMWGKMTSCGGLATFVGNPPAASIGRPITNRPQDAILPHKSLLAYTHALISALCRRIALAPLVCCPPGATRLLKHDRSDLFFVTVSRDSRIPIRTSAGIPRTPASAPRSRPPTSRFDPDRSVRAPPQPKMPRLHQPRPHRRPASAPNAAL